jgi:hypothetical protein
MSQPGIHTIHCPVELNGRVSTNPPSDRGDVPINCHLVVEGRYAVLVDFGLSVHQDAIVDALRRLLPDNAFLSLLPLRYGEFFGVCNTRVIAEQIGAEQLYGTYFGRPEDWLDFRPDLRQADGARGGGLAGLTALPLSLNDSVAVDPARRRVLEVFAPPLRLLPEPWIYDRPTSTLITSDVFTWGRAATEGPPWEVSDATDATQFEDVWSHLVGGRYWWLPGARTLRLREALAAMCERYEIETIAPGSGCVLRGRATVERHMAMLDEVLRQAADVPALPPVLAATTAVTS